MSTISPFKEGAVIQVAQGVLRGVGPVGPRGYTGPAGPPGPQGPEGKQPDFTPVTAFFTRSSTATMLTTSPWQRIQLTTTNYSVNSLATLTGSGTARTNASDSNGASILLTPSIMIVPGGGGTETFRVELGVFTGANTTPFASSIFTHANGSTPSTFTFTTQYLIPQGLTDIGIGVRITAASVGPVVSFASLGLSSTGGADGGPGPEGPAGPEGPQGSIGPPGNANSGFVAFDSITQSGVDSDADPGGTTGTPNQGLPYPLGSQSPAVPWFIKNLVNSAAKRVVRRFADESAMTAATDKEVGQVAFLSSNNSLRLMTSVGGTPTPATIAQVTYGTTDPTGTYPAGTIYFKVA